MATGTEITTSYHRVTPRPLDVSARFDTYVFAEIYALNTDEEDTCPYEGQVVYCADTQELYRLKKDSSMYNEDDETIDGKSGHFALVRIDRKVIFFGGIISAGSPLEQSVNVLAEPGKVYYFAAAGRFGLAYAASKYEVVKYYSNWANRTSWEIVEDALYVDVNGQKTYIYDGDSLVQVGGSSDELKKVVLDSVDDYEAITTKDSNTLYLIKG